MSTEQEEKTLKDLKAGDEVAIKHLDVHGSLSSGSWQKQCEALGISRDSFNYTIKGLEKDGVIVRTEFTVGKQKRVNYSLPDHCVLAPVMCVPGGHTFLGNPDYMTGICSLHRK